MAGSNLDHLVWGQYWPGNTNNGIYQYWRALKSADPPQYLGPPISDEVEVSDDVVQRAFASGAVIQWSAAGGGELANDPLQMPTMWWTPVWTPRAAEPYPPDPELPIPGISYNPYTPAVIQTADWTCSCASSAWLLNSLGDGRLGRPWNEWDVVDALRAATYPGAVSPDYGLARADMYDLEVMFRALGYVAVRRQYLTREDILAWSGAYPLQMNGARWYHHTGARMVGPGVIYLANPAPSWKGVGQELNADEAAAWGSWNGMVIVDRLT